MFSRGASLRKSRVSPEYVKCKDAEHDLDAAYDETENSLRAAALEHELLSIAQVRTTNSRKTEFICCTHTWP